MLDSGSELMLLIWPGGRFDQNARVVVLGGQRFRHGDRLGLGGVELAPNDLMTLRVPPLPECLTDVAWRITSITPS